jgi:DNA-binding NarL/FixJ family response regulator
MDGMAALKELKGRKNGATVLILSASTSDERGSEALASGADAFLPKNRALDELAPLIRRLAARG